MIFFHLFCNLTIVIFLNEVKSGSIESCINAEDSTNVLEQKGNTIIKKFFKTNEFCTFFNLMEEVNGMIKEIGSNLCIEKSLNNELIKTTKTFMDNSTIIKSLSNREAILHYNDRSIQLFKEFIPLHKKKKDKERTMIFSFLIEKFVFKLKDLNKSLKKVKKKPHLNLPRFKSIKEKLNSLKHVNSKIKLNYKIYSDLLGENVEFYNNMREMLIKLFVIFNRMKKETSVMENNILKKETFYYNVLVIGNFGRLYDCYKDDNARLKRIYKYLNEVWHITESLKFLYNENT